MPHDFLGIGWSFPVTAGAGPENAPLAAEPAHYEESVRQSIWIILSTARGERVMRPDFGCGIHNLVFALDNPSTIGLVEHEVEQSLLYWEPRINVIKVFVEADRRGEADPSSLAMAYARYRELELKRRFYALPHVDREALRRRTLEAGAKIGGRSPATLLPGEGDNQVIQEIGKKEEVPNFEKWRDERKAELSGPSLLITIEYAVKATNSRFNVVYPFYLERRPVNA
jgi:phage baseplate assembly protein W